MTQLPLAVVPEADTQCGMILRALQDGQALTPLSALDQFRCLSLSQRIGNLKRMGWPIVSEMVKLPSGKYVAQYRLHRMDHGA